MIAFEYTSYGKDSILVIHMNGVLTSQTTEMFEETATPLITAGKSIILDMKNLEYASSEGLGALLFLAKKADTQQCHLLLAGAQNELATLFHYIGFDKIIPTYETLEQALNKVGQGKEMTPSPVFSQTHAASKIRETAPVAREQQQEQHQDVFDSPLIIECVRCHSFVRVSKPGHFLCPSCRTEFEVKKSGTVLFK